MPIALVYLVLLVLAFFLLVVQPQRRQLARHRALVASLEVGDEVITTGGVHGIIRSMDDTILELEIADGVVIRLARGAVGSRVNPPPGDDVVAEESERRREAGGGAG
jgi:preprotein translocase subunit YajC